MISSIGPMKQIWKSKTLVKFPFSGTIASFTLIELLLVVILLGVLVGLVVPNFGPTFANIQLKETTNNISYLMRYAQSRAVIKNDTHRLNFDTQFSRYWISQLRLTEEAQDEGAFERISGRLGRVFKVPPQISIETDNQTIAFYPDGKIDKTRIYVTNNRGHTFTVSTQEQLGYVHTFDSRYP